MPSGQKALAAALALISVLVPSACGGSDEAHPPETIGTARRAIESLPYKIDVREIAGQEGALLGVLHGKLGETERFYVFVHGHGPLRIDDVAHALGVSNARQIEGGELTESYALFSPVIRRTGETRPQIEEGSSAIFAAEEALCEQATGEGCGI